MSENEKTADTRLSNEREKTQRMLDRIGVFDVSHATERELLAMIRTLCQCMIDEGLGEP